MLIPVTQELYYCPRGTGIRMDDWSYVGNAESASTCIQQCPMALRDPGDLEDTLPGTVRAEVKTVGLDQFCLLPCAPHHPLWLQAATIAHHTALCFKSKERVCCLLWKPFTPPFVIADLTQSTISLNIFSDPCSGIFPGLIPILVAAKLLAAVTGTLSFLFCSLLSHGYQSKTSDSVFAALFDLVRGLLFKGQVMLLYGHISWSLKEATIMWSV